jgi:protein-L-isoaspartate(D-aspartate) O-methyltransferase
MSSRTLKATTITIAGLLVVVGGCITDVPTAGYIDTQKSPTADEELARQRQRMVREQLKARDIADDRVLASMLKVPRHRFVPPGMVESAYDDNALPLALGQTVSQPYIVAFMTQALRLNGAERVLEIGTGSGYQAAVLAEIVREVYTIEILPELTDRARTILTELGYANIHYKIGDGYQGWLEFAPFDCIMVTAAPDHVPQPLVDQLRVGGRMIIPVGNFEQELVLIEKGPAGVTRRSTIPVRFVPMRGIAEHPPKNK